ncbi:MAG: DUF2586 family protein [Sphingobacteriaceae bacterium]|nr:DUF2586 family protein [Sphingobacteriaceae bacterium]
MAIDGVKFTRKKPSASGANTDDSVSALLATVAISTKPFELGVVKKVYGIEDVEALGITAAYDVANKCTLYRQLSEFYRMAGKGTKLYLMLADQTKTMCALFDDLSVQKLIYNTEGDVKQLGFILCPADNYAPTMLNGMNADVFNAIPKAQSFADWCFDNHRPLHVFLEGRNYGGVASAVQNLRNIPNVEAGNVSVVGLQDYKYAALIGGSGLNYADVGIVLGITAKASVSQNIAEVASFNIMNIGLGRYEIAGLSSHHTITEKASDLQTLDTNGWIIPITYADYNGIYLNDDHSCVKEVQDLEGNLNESSVWKSRTLGKALRLIRKSLIPEIKKRYPTEPSTGYLTPDAVMTLKGIAEDAVQTMLLAKDITAVSVSIAKESNLFSGDRTLNITSIKIVGVGNIGIIKANINLSSKI